MSETQTGELLLLLAALFGLTFALGGLLEKLRIPGILGALFVAMAVAAGACSDTSAVV